MYSREQYNKDRKIVTEFYEEAKRDLSKAEATLRIYEAYQKGIENIITENVAAGDSLEYITDLFLPEMEEIGKKIIDANISLEQQKLSFKTANYILDQASEIFGKMLAAEKWGTAVYGN